MSKINDILESQRLFFQSGKTKAVSFRKDSLKKLLRTVERKEKEICEALFKDFRKPEFESAATETVIIIQELKLTIKNINKWAKPKSVRSSLLNFPSRDFIYPEPYGNTLIISPWNYPYQLALSPLIGAIAAGNTAVVKPSEMTPETSALIADVIAETFAPEHVTVVQGGADISQELLKEKWDYIFFTGSVKVGKIVAKAAAEDLTPVTLELGGKNPCIVDATAKVDLAAKRIVWGKFLNAGQTCIAPDYVLVHEKIEESFIKSLKEEIEKAYGKNPIESEDYPGIINTSNFERLQEMLQDGTLVHGGESDDSRLYIAPTILKNPSLESKVMQDEIFGPILPVLTYASEKALDMMIRRYPNPLSLYVFTSDSKFSEEMITRYSFGGGTVNDTIVHFVNHRLPFGGVGNSGIGAYHGKNSFITFSHQKAITKRATWLDIPLRYAPYAGKVKWLRKFTKFT